MAKSKRPVDDDDDDTDDTPAVPSDAYVGLLGIASVALLGAAVLLYMDGESLAKVTAQPPSVTAAAEGLNPPAAPAPR